MRKSNIIIFFQNPRRFRGGARPLAGVALVGPHPRLAGPGVGPARRDARPAATAPRRDAACCPATTTAGA
jgi:hypothetical protein